MPMSSQGDVYDLVSEVTVQSCKGKRSYSVRGDMRGSQLSMKVELWQTTLMQDYFCHYHRQIFYILITSSTVDWWQLYCSRICL